MWYNVSKILRFRELEIWHQVKKNNGKKQRRNVD